MVTLELATEQIFKAIGHPVAKKQFENTCRICEIMLRVNEILTLLRSSVYYPCYVSSTVST